jgi:hypothetical protein
MRRTILLLAGVLLSAVALGSDSPKEYDDKTEVAGIEGTWQLTEDEFNGVKMKPCTQLVTSYRSGTYTCQSLSGKIRLHNLIAAEEVPPPRHHTPRQPCASCTRPT